MSTDNFSQRRPPSAFFRGIYIGAYGDFPHPCYFCEKSVAGYTIPYDARAAVIHHADDDPWNNAPDNLKPAHLGCHSGHHNAHRGTVSAEFRAKVSEGVRRAWAEGRLSTTPAKLGHPAWNKGRTASPELRATLSAAHKGIPLSLAHRAALSAVRKGRQQSPEHVAKRAAALRGKSKSPEWRAQHSATMTGRTHTPETRAKLSAAGKRAWAKRKEQSMIQYTDALGPVVDTGCNTQPSVRPSVDTEIHTVQELETGSKLALTAIAASHVQHRPAGHPR